MIVRRNSARILLAPMLTHIQHYILPHETQSRLLQTDFPGFLSPFLVGMPGLPFAVSPKSAPAADIEKVKLGAPLL